MLRVDPNNIRAEGRTELSQPYQRYLVVGYDGYYPSGFSRDIVADTDDLIEACAFLKSMSEEYREIFDLDARESILLFALGEGTYIEEEAENASEVREAWERAQGEPQGQ